MLSKQRFPLFDGLRALAATLVFTYHAWFIYHRPDCGLVECHPDTSFVGGIWKGAVVNFGAQGVALFYVISGFLLYRQFVAGRESERFGLVSARGYAARRLARILPAYWAVMIIVGLTTVNSPMVHLSGFVQYMGFAQIYTQGALWRNPVPPTWTICVELSFYVFLPVWAVLIERLLAFIGGSWRTELLALGGLAGLSVVWKLWVLQRGLVSNDFQPWLVALPASLDVFAAGMALAVVSVHGRDLLGSGHGFVTKLLTPSCIWLAAIGLFALTCWLSAFDGPFGSDWQARSLILAVLKIPVAVGLVLPATMVFRRGTVGDFLSARAVVWVGVVSYGLYLWHVPLLRWVGGVDVPVFTSGNVTLALVSVLAYAATLAVAATSWRLLELPAISYARYAQGRDRAAPDSVGRQGVSTGV